MKPVFILFRWGNLLIRWLFCFLIRVDAFESLYRLSREYKHWELDEIIIAVFSAIIVVPVSLSIFTSRNLRNLRS